MPDFSENPHHERENGYGIAFWKDNTAANRDTANRAVVYTGPPGMPYPEFTFSLPNQRHDMEKLISALQKAFAAGIYAGKEEVRRALGVPSR